MAKITLTVSNDDECMIMALQYSKELSAKNSFMTHVVIFKTSPRQPQKQVHSNGEVISHQLRWCPLRKPMLAYQHLPHCQRKKEPGNGCTGRETFHIKFLSVVQGTLPDPRPRAANGPKGSMMLFCCKWRQRRRTVICCYDTMVLVGWNGKLHTFQCRAEPSGSASSYVRVCPFFFVDLNFYNHPVHHGSPAWAATRWLVERQGIFSAWSGIHVLEICKHWPTPRSVESTKQVETHKLFHFSRLAHVWHAGKSFIVRKDLFSFLPSSFQSLLLAAKEIPIRVRNNRNTQTDAILLLRRLRRHRLECSKSFSCSTTWLSLTIIGSTSNGGGASRRMEHSSIRES